MPEGLERTAGDTVRNPSRFGPLGSLFDGELTSVADQARDLEEHGFGAVWLGENRHDVFVQAMAAAGTTRRLTVGTCAAVAFSRNPMTVAYAANDLQAATHGRFVLGLSSQVKPHIERRFSMSWSSPAARMRDFVLALRAIWSSWTDGTPLEFTGTYYRHTLMNPAFDPGPNRFGPPPVYLAGVGERMTEVAGEVADGFIVHTFSSPAYFDTVTSPALDRGRDGPAPSPAFAVLWPALVVTGVDPHEHQLALEAARKQLAFYASTPGFDGVLAVHGLEGIHHDLRILARTREWDAMADKIDDSILQTFAVVAKPEEVATAVHDRFGRHATQIACSMPIPPSLELMRRIAAGDASNSRSPSDAAEQRDHD